MKKRFSLRKPLCYLFIISRLQGREAVHFFVFVGEVISVVKAAFVCDLTYTHTGLSSDKLVCFSEAEQGNVFVKAKTGGIFEDSREVLLTYGLHFCYRRKLDIGCIILLYILYYAVYQLVAGGCCLEGAGMTKHKVKQFRCVTL